MSERIRIELFETDRGSCPFEAWMNRLSSTTRARVMTHIDRLSLGNFGVSKSLGGGLYEVRMHFGPGYRVYFGKRGDTVVILLCGGDKGSQRRDIEKAKEYWRQIRKQGG